MEPNADSLKEVYLKSGWNHRYGAVEEGQNFCTRARVQPRYQVWGWLFEGFELLDEFVELRFARPDDFGRSVSKRFFAGDAIQQALFGELFVAGEIEADDQVDLAVRRSLGGLGLFGRFGLGFGFRLRRGFGSFGRFRGGLGRFGRGGRVAGRRGRVGGFGGFGFAPLELVEQLFVQPEGLLPVLELMAGLLRFFFVGAEIEKQIGVSHEMSLRREAQASQGKVKKAGVVSRRGQGRGRSEKRRYRNGVYQISLERLVGPREFEKSKTGAMGSRVGLPPGDCVYVRTACGRDANGAGSGLLRGRVLQSSSSPPWKDQPNRRTDREKCRLRARLRA